MFHPLDARPCDHLARTDALFTYPAHSFRTRKPMLLGYAIIASSHRDDKGALLHKRVGIM